MACIPADGTGGFIGGHIVKGLTREGFWVRAVDLKPHEFNPRRADDLIIADVRDPAGTGKAVV